MSFRDPTDRARENWDALDAYQRNEVVAAAALRINRDPDAYGKALGAGVVSVGHGYRERRPRGKRRAKVVREPALKVYVKDKWTKKEDAAATMEERVPEAVQLRLRVPPPLPQSSRGRKAREHLWNPEAESPRQGSAGSSRYLEVAVPTDVATEITTARAQGADKPLRILARASNGTGGVSGTACTVVKVRGTQGTQPFLLGCIHVVMRAKITPGAVPDRRATNVVAESGTEKRIDSPAQGRPSPVGALLFSPKNQVNLDAALVRLNDAGHQLILDRSFWPAIPTRWIRNRKDLIAFASSSGYPIRLHSARGRTHALRYAGHIYQFWVRYGPDNGPHTDLRIVEVIRFLASPRTIGGDSGSPVTGGKYFLGMHIAGVGDAAFMIPAYHLFARKAYPAGAPAVHRGLDLATDLIS